MQEKIVPGPNGTEAVMLTIDEDIHIQEAIKKNETIGEGLHAKSVESNAVPHGNGNSSAENTSRTADVGASSSNSNH